MYYSNVYLECMVLNLLAVELGWLRAAAAATELLSSELE